MLPDKDFDRLIQQIEQVPCGWRGYSLTKEQFETLEDSWEAVRLCYVPCYQPEDSPESVEINNDEVYSILHYRCGSGWQLAHSELTLEEAREIKKRYNSTLQQVKIVQVIE